jgi:hypothetical protein
MGADWRHEHLSHAGWAKEIVLQMNTSWAQEFGANLGPNVVHRVVLFCVYLLALFFCFATARPYRCNVEPHH